jgi:hypothetical protein
MSKVLFSILFLSSLHCQAQRFISGHVIEESTQKPIAYVNVTLSDGSGTATNEGGWFRIAMPENSNHLKIRVS